MRLASLLVLLLSLAMTPADPWESVKRTGYTYYFQDSDRARNPEYLDLVEQGLRSVSAFFPKPFPKSFEVYVHPTRQSWDAKLQVAYQMPDFKSECWMVASGDGFQLNMISPATWDTAACEHRYGDQEATQQLIAHELFHVYHGQQNPSPDFAEVQGLDWLVEGLATYASGQLTAQRMQGVRNLVAENKAPASLDDFWKGQHRYGLSGSVVQHIDQQYGRAMLFSLLAFRTKTEAFAHLQVTEAQLLDDWRKRVLSTTEGAVKK
jgi:hypothetical protein